MHALLVQRADQIDGCTEGLARQAGRRSGVGWGTIFIDNPDPKPRPSIFSCANDCLGVPDALSGNCLSYEERGLYSDAGGFFYSSRATKRARTAAE